MRHRLSLFVIALMTATTVVMGAAILANTHSAQAQFAADPEVIASQIYEILPEFPRENQYINRKKKQLAENNTLISRLIRYHTYNQGRSPQYRLDWKFTFADYLGLNGYISPDSYPGANFLNKNPFEQDQAIIQSLNRTERNTLTQVIVDAYNPDIQSQRPTEPIEPSKAVSPTLPNTVPMSERATDLLAPASPVEPDGDQPSGPARLLRIDETP